MNTNDFIKRLIDFTISVHDSIDDLRNNVRPEITTPQQYKILEMLYLNKNSSVSEICACLGISLPNTSREIKKLSALGYIEKIPHPTDGRRVTISLTDKGIETMDKAFNKINDIYRDKLTDISESEQEELLSSMNDLTSKFFSSSK